KGTQRAAPPPAHKAETPPAAPSNSTPYSQSPSLTSAKLTHPSLSCHPDPRHATQSNLAAKGAGNLAPEVTPGKHSAASAHCPQPPLLSHPYAILGATRGENGLHRSHPVRSHSCDEGKGRAPPKRPAHGEVRVETQGN